MSSAWSIPGARRYDRYCIFHSPLHTEGTMFVETEDEFSKRMESAERID
jgi:hypothetical protein